MNQNQITTIIFVLTIIGSLSGVVLGLVPPQYAALTIALFGLLSEVTNALKSGYADKPVEPE
jgi:uncharacterized membrane protein YuzA (DUF378 family)